jgi:transcriptional regulator with XRE-family HTH domain
MLLKADFIRAQRHQRGWTQEQMAELCDISVRTVQRLEKTGMASMETTNALAAVLELDRVALLDDGEGEEAPVAHTAISQRDLWLAAGATFILGLLLGQFIDVEIDPLVLFLSASDWSLGRGIGAWIAV